MIVIPQLHSIFINISPMISSCSYLPSFGGHLPLM